jgi:hypothetical protein
MRSFGWLHFTDLHQGLDAQGWLWPGVRENLFADLEKLHERCGPWDFVLFSGDLTQRAAPEEFERLTRDPRPAVGAPQGARLDPQPAGRARQP